jgi:GntR family transcriptional repressor for pyruvate dehydrogenase complex
LTSKGGHGGPEGPTAASSIADHLAAHILEQLVPGASLPSEAELAQQYQVSRLTIREAVKLLAGRGLLELARGRRAVVREPNGSAFGDFLTTLIQHDPKGIFDLVEVRKSLEIQSASLAAKHANRAAIAAIEAALQGMRDAEAEWQSGRDPVASELRFHEFDMGFHEALALASGNRVLTFLFEAMSAPLQESFHISMRGHEIRGHTFADTVDAHERILQAIVQGNSRKAAEAMRSHLENTERDIRAAMSLLSSGRRTRR